MPTSVVFAALLLAPWVEAASLPSVNLTETGEVNVTLGANQVQLNVCHASRCSGSLRIRYPCSSTSCMYTVNFSDRTFMNDEMHFSPFTGCTSGYISSTGLSFWSYPAPGQVIGSSNKHLTTTFNRSTTLDVYTLPTDCTVELVNAVPTSYSGNDNLFMALMLDWVTWVILGSALLVIVVSGCTLLLLKGRKKKNKKKPVRAPPQPNVTRPALQASPPEAVQKYTVAVSQPSQTSVAAAPRFVAPRVPSPPAVATTRSAPVGAQVRDSVAEAPLKPKSSPTPPMLNEPCLCGTCPVEPVLSTRGPPTPTARSVAPPKVPTAPPLLAPSTPSSVTISPCQCDECLSRSSVFSSPVKAEAVPKTAVGVTSKSASTSVTK